MTLVLLTYNLWVYSAKATVYDGIPWETGLYFKAEVFKAQPHNYWNLTDPDPYILEAINNPDKWVWVNQTEETFLEQASPKFECFIYQGILYSYRIVFLDVFKLPDRTAEVSLAVLIPTWGIFLVANRKKFLS